MTRSFLLVSLWLCLAWFTRLDRVFVIISILVAIFANLGQRKAGQHSAYNVFNRGFRRLLSDLSGAQIEAEMRNKRVTNAGAGIVGLSDDEEPVSFSSKEGNRTCGCGSGKKVKKCCGKNKLVRNGNRREEKHLDEFNF